MLLCRIIYYCYYHYLLVTNPYTVKSVLFILALTLTSTFRESHPLISANRLQDIRLYNSYVVTRCYKVVLYHCDDIFIISTYLLLQNTVSICTEHCTKHNRINYSWGLFQQTSHIDIVWNILTLCRHSIYVLPTTQRVVLTPRCVNHLEYLWVRIATSYEYVYFRATTFFSLSSTLLS